MLKIGITGGIGSGKTVICKLFKLQNIPVFFADTVAKEIMHTDMQLVEAIKTAFGKDIYSDDGLLNRRKLATLVFNNKKELEKLNSLVHPAVFQAFHNWVKQQNAPYVLKEAALLFESGSYKECDFTILVKSPESLKIARVAARDSVTEAEVINRMNQQLSDKKKEEISDFIINNDERQLLIPQVLNLHAEFLKKIRKA